MALSTPLDPPRPPSRALLVGDAAMAVRALGAAYGLLDAEALLRVMIRHEFPGRIAVVSSFGSESAVLLDLVARIDPATPVLFLDTGKHFPETIAYRDKLVAHLGLRDLRPIHPAEASVASEDPAGDLWRRAPDRCCALRKASPLQSALAGFDAWITGRKRYQGGSRSELTTIEAAEGRVKLNPLAAWDPERLRREFGDRGLPDHPLRDLGYDSIGCATCTAKVLPGAPPRSGRWAGLDKTECGIHRAPWYRPHGMATSALPE